MAPVIYTVAELAIGGMASACLLAAAVTDVGRRLIPNELVFMILLAGIGLRMLAGPAAVWISLAIFVGAVLLLGLLASFRLIGWGDVKLIAAATVLFPPRDSPTLMLAIAVSGGFLACFYLVARHFVRSAPVPPRQAGLRSGWARQFDRERARIRANEPMPYAVAICGGVASQTVLEALRCWPATCSWP